MRFGSALVQLHSIWLPTSDPEQPFVRVKEDECDPEIDFDVQTVEKLVDRMTQCGIEPTTFSVKQLPDMLNYRQPYTAPSFHRPTDRCYLPDSNRARIAP